MKHRSHATGARIAALVQPLAALALSALAFSALAQSVAPGARVTYRDAAGRDWCATVRTVEVGVDATSWAWLSIDADPRRVARAAVADLVADCKP